MLTDSHTHLYLEEFAADIDAVIERAGRAGVNRFYMPAIDSSQTLNLLALADKYPTQCFAMMGLHPCSVKENYREEMELVEEWLRKRKFAAIGETGLDLYWDKTFRDQQYECLHRQIEWALAYDLPVVLHTREAMQETIDVVSQYKGRGLRGIFHCFGGSLQQAEQITEAGFLMGIGGVITYKKSGLAEVVKNIDLSHLVLETDAPYLSPVPFRGKRNESSYLTYVVQAIALAKNISAEEVANITSQNATGVFGL